MLLLGVRMPIELGHPSARVRILGTLLEFLTCDTCSRVLKHPAAPVKTMRTMKPFRGTVRHTKLFPTIFTGHPPASLAGGGVPGRHFMLNYFPHLQLLTTLPMNPLVARDPFPFLP